MKWKKIDWENDPRRGHFEYFASLAYPYVGVTADVDVTELVRFCKERNYSFYLVFLHLSALALDSIPQFRRRIRNGEAVEYDECPTSHTELMENGAYCYCTLRHHMPLEAYIEYAEKARRLSREAGSIEEDDDVESMYFISTLPWIHYTALIQPVAGGEEANPRITWGKFSEDAHGRKQMPVTVLAHHGFVDGIHIAEFYRKLEEILKETVR